MTSKARKTILHRISRAIIWNQNRLLLVKNLDSPHYYLPGGHIEAHEAPLAALLRELKEEIGLICRDTIFLGEFPNTWHDSIHTHKETNWLYIAHCNQKLASKLKSKEKGLTLHWISHQALLSTPIYPSSLRDAALKSYETFGINNYTDTQHAGMASRNT